jgi:hypothetical protein
MTLASSNRAEINGNVLPLSLEAVNITSTGDVRGDIPDSVISVTAVDENMALISNIIQISDKGLSEAINITSIGAVGMNISESVVSVTAIDENMALASNTVQGSDNALSLSSEATNIIQTGVVGGLFSSMVVTVITDSEISLPKTPVEVIFVTSDGNDTTLPLSCTVLDTSAIFTSVTLTVITDSEVYPPEIYQNR